MINHINTSIFGALITPQLNVEMRLYDKNVVIFIQLLLAVALILYAPITMPPIQFPMCNVQLAPKKYKTVL